MITVGVSNPMIAGPVFARSVRNSLSPIAGRSKGMDQRFWLAAIPGKIARLVANVPPGERMRVEMLKHVDGSAAIDHHQGGLATFNEQAVYVGRKLKSRVC